MTSAVGRRVEGIFRRIARLAGLARKSCLSCSLLLAACHSPGPYGYAIEYAPLPEEEDAAEETVEYDPVMAARDPKSWRNKKVSVFGIVEEYDSTERGRTRLVLSIRALADRNLCDEGGEETCRVTVSERSHGELAATIRLRPSDDGEKEPLQPGSLVRVIGPLRYVSNEGGGAPPTLSATYYRHWPQRKFVTTQARSFMLR